MAKVSSGLTLSTDYFMRNFYSNNRGVIKQSNRGDFSNVELSYEDSRALSRAAKRLRSNDYGSDDRKDSESDINDTTKASIEAFVKTYNNTIASARDSSDRSTQHYVRQLKTLSSKYTDELEDIGITIEKNGTLSINDDLLKAADNSKARKLFSPDGEYSKKSMTIARKLNSAVHDDIFSQMTSKGLHINISL